MHVHVIAFSAAFVNHFQIFKPNGLFHTASNLGIFIKIFDGYIQLSMHVYPHEPEGEEEESLFA